MVGFCHRHIPTIFITDKFPPWWVFVMVGICRQAMMMITLRRPGSIQRTVGAIAEKDETQEPQEAHHPPLVYWG